MTKVFNKKSETNRRKHLRNNIPRAEQVLWDKLKSRQLNGFKFRRQYSVDKYVLDFYCPEAKLGIEVDGPSHFSDTARDFDKKRQGTIESFGIELIRFTNNDIFENLDAVLTKIFTCSPLKK